MVLFHLAEVLRDLRDQQIVPYDLDYNRTKALTMGQIVIFYITLSCIYLNLFKLKRKYFF